MCRNTRAIITRVPRHYRLMTADPPPNGAAYADEGDANLLLSFHVCLTRKHAMPQVHSRFCDSVMATKYRALWTRQEALPRGECMPIYHALINVRVPSRLLFIMHRLDVHPGTGVSRGLRGDQQRSPRAHLMPFCCFLPRYATCDSVLHRHRSTGGHRPSFGHRKPPSSTPRTLRAAMRMVAQRPAMVHRIGRVVLLDIECPLNGCP